MCTVDECLLARDPRPPPASKGHFTEQDKRSHFSPDQKGGQVSPLSRGQLFLQVLLFTWLFSSFTDLPIKLKRHERRV